MDIMSLVIWLAIGAVAGWLAGRLWKGGCFGTLGNIVIGILGSFVGGFLANQLSIGAAETGSFNVASILTAVAGALVLLFLVSLVKKKT